MLNFNSSPIANAMKKFKQPKCQSGSWKYSKSYTLYSNVVLGQESSPVVLLYISKLSTVEEPAQLENYKNKWINKNAFVNIPDSTASMFCNIISQSKITVPTAPIQIPPMTAQFTTWYQLQHDSHHPCHTPPCHVGLRSIETQNNTGNQNLKWPIRQTWSKSHFTLQGSLTIYATSILKH